MNLKYVPVLFLSFAGSSASLVAHVPEEVTKLASESQQLEEDQGDDQNEDIILEQEEPELSIEEGEEEENSLSNDTAQEQPDEEHTDTIEEALLDKVAAQDEVPAVDDICENSEEVIESKAQPEQQESEQTQEVESSSKALEEKLNTLDTEAPSEIKQDTLQRDDESGTIPAVDTAAQVDKSIEPQASEPQREQQVVRQEQEIKSVGTNINIESFFIGADSDSSCLEAFKCLQQSNSEHESFLKTVLMAKIKQIKIDKEQLKWYKREINRSNLPYRGGAKVTLSRLNDIVPIEHKAYRTALINEDDNLFNNILESFFWKQSNNQMDLLERFVKEWNLDLNKTFFLHKIIIQGNNSSWHKNIVSIVEKAIQLGADPNLRDEHGKTALQYVTTSTALSVIVTLVENGADPSITDKAGDTVTHKFARECYCPDAIEKMHYLNKNSNDQANKAGFTAQDLYNLCQRCRR